MVLGFCYNVGVMKSKITRFVFLVLSALAIGRLGAAQGRQPLLPEREWAMIRQIAVNYDFDEERTWLLAAIRKHENGRPGLEFGIGGPMKNGHPSHRYRDGFKSFYVQGMWAAGTIKRHYHGDLVAFGKRYNPPYPVKWTNGVSSILASLKAENHFKLPGAKPPKREINFP